MGQIKSKLNWLVVVKIKTIGRIKVDESLEVDYQNDVYSDIHHMTIDDFDEPLVDDKNPHEPINITDIAQKLGATELEDKLTKTR